MESVIKPGTLDDVRRDMEHGVYDFTKDGKCSCCGACCSNLLPMSQKEIDRIRKYVKQYNVKPHNHNAPTVKKNIDMTCPFMDNSKQFKCDIYPIRPKVCREFSCHKTFDNRPELKEMYIPVFVREEFF